MNLPHAFCFLRGLALAAVVSVCSAQGVNLSLDGLLCDSAENPLGIDSAPPRLSWKLRSDERGQRQTAWQVLVASSAEILAAEQGDAWDSGRRPGDDQLYVSYAGRALKSSERVYWKMRVWDRDGQPSSWSAPATWTMGVLSTTDWHARWITAAERQPDNATLLLRREFSVKPGLRRALAHVTGVGAYELTLNGARVGTDLLSPGWTAYEKTCLYDTHDITALLRPGPNAAGLFLGNGMYSVQKAEGRYAKFTGAYRPPFAIAQLRLEYADGSVEFVGTDDSWRTHAGPITFSNIFGGEDHDARLEPAGWDRPAFDESAWPHAVVADGPGGQLRGTSHTAPPLRAHESLHPVAVKEIRPRVAVYDLGQNVSLIPRLRVHGPAGSEVKIIPAELLNADGSVDRSSVGGPRNNAWWRYTLAARAEGAEWLPKFFYHGCRYLQVELSSPEGQPLPVIESLDGVVVHTASAPAGDFACSDELFNRIRTLVRWAQRSNLASVITDCPHRERLGWLEQYHLNGPALRSEFDLTRLFAKTFGDMADAQTPDGLVPDIAPEFTKFSGGFRDSPEWGSAFVLSAAQHYTWTGDLAPLRRHYEAMQRYVAYLAGKSTGRILSHGLGDWYDIGPAKPGRSQLTPIALTATAFYFHDTVTLAFIARLLGRADDAGRYAAEAEKIRAAFNAKFFDAPTGSYATGSQTANALALVLGLAEPAERPRVLDALVRDVQSHGLTAGDVGYRFLLRALADDGRSDVIFALNHQTEKPGYGYQLARGATSLTEAWDAGRTSSQNHFMLGQITEWFYHDLAGLGAEPDSPGFQRIVIRPQPVGDITWARATHESPRGKILSSWKREAGRFTLDVEIPPGATALIFVPTSDPSTVREGSALATQSVGVNPLRVAPGHALYAVGSGRYQFSASAP